ncbi:MAG: ATP-binding cassette domain-containing protein [Firmicutes bacterium]|nr:ATP-binding cassette domain-containing protein [Bacillota bacterium]
MLKLINISKDYKVGDTLTHALIDINLEFRENEFVSILGQSGSGKTTLLNLIGGLDHYQKGDLLVDGKSTKGFIDNEWDSYRNATIGFVFQNYNLISHLSVLDNVEIALTLSGVSVAERKERAKNALIDVGLEDQIKKKPNQLSGGQMQRVAIARALVNNPKILLADEPTGAIDSKTSIQILDLLKEISKDRLVIMVTHNVDLAEKYSDRIIQLLDGKIILDSKDYKESLDTKTTGKLINKKISMSFMTALKSSYKNLTTKKTRTLITAIAGSIGIIGIALVLAISNGMTQYVNSMQSDTLAGFPLTISRTVSTTNDMLSQPQQHISDLTGITTSLIDFPTTDIIYSYDAEANTRDHTNIITEDYINYIQELDETLYNSISYTSSVTLNVIAETDNGGYVKVNTSVTSSSFGFSSDSYFNEIPNSREFIETQYDLLGSNSSYPENYNEIVLIVDKQNRVDISLLEDFGITINDEFVIDDFIGMQFKVVTNNDYYTQNESIFIANTDYESMYVSGESITLTIVGVMRVKESASSEILSTGIGYTSMLTTQVLSDALTSDVVVAQEASLDVNVLTGQPFNDIVTYQNVMRTIGGDDSPTGIQIYPVSFDSKDAIKTYLDAYNLNLDGTDMVIYTDLAETISGTISTLISTITLILSSFAAISLIVSSIMIGIITYVSVVERTKEIGILRSIGARKKDISRVFNAETIIIGLTAGVIGIIVTILLIFPINMIIQRALGISSFASLPILSALGLILISIGLTFISGLIPSKIAANKDPVVALRTE